MQDELPNTHWSDCAVHNGPAYSPGACDCGGLHLTDNSLHGPISATITRPGGLRRLSQKNEAQSLVESQHFPADRLIMDTAASNLPNPHHLVTSGTNTNSMHLNIPDVPIVPDF